MGHTLWSPLSKALISFWRWIQPWRQLAKANTNSGVSPEKKEESILTLQTLCLAKIASLSSREAKHQQVTNSGSPQAKHKRQHVTENKDPWKRHCRGPFQCYCFQKMLCLRVRWGHTKCTSSHTPKQDLQLQPTLLFKATACNGGLQKKWRARKPQRASPTEKDADQGLQVPRSQRSCW